MTVKIPLIRGGKVIGYVHCCSQSAPQEYILRDIEGETVVFLRGGNAGKWKYEVVK